MADPLVRCIHCNKATINTQDRVCAACAQPERPRLTVVGDGGDHRMSHLWITYGDAGYRITLPIPVATELLRIVNWPSE